jgi:hypothetical protein
MLSPTKGGNHVEIQDGFPKSARLLVGRGDFLDCSLELMVLRRALSDMA